MVCPRQEYWSGLPFPSPGNLPHPKTEPGSPALQADSSPTECQGSPPPLFFFPVGTYVLPIWKQTGVEFLALFRFVGWNWIFFFFFFWISVPQSITSLYQGQVKGLGFCSSLMGSLYLCTCFATPRHYLLYFCIWCLERGPWMVCFPSKDIWVSKLSFLEKIYLWGCI